MEQSTIDRNAGWSSTKLKLEKEDSESISFTAVMIIVNGQILDEWGDTTSKIDVRSIMKPLMNALYGIAVAEGKINIQRTLAELGVDDKLPPLTEGEKQARIFDSTWAKASGRGNSSFHSSGSPKASSPIPMPVVGGAATMECFGGSP